VSSANLAIFSATLTSGEPSVTPVDTTGPSSPSRERFVLEGSGQSSAKRFPAAKLALDASDIFEVEDT